MNRFISLVSGIIFGIGLVISQMINPEKVLGFLDIFGKEILSLLDETVFGHKLKTFDDKF